MKVTLLFFSVLRDIVGADRLERDWPVGGAPLGDLVAAVRDEFPGLGAWEGRMLLAVNGEYADVSCQVYPGDEVALMPPVQGG